MNHSDIIVVGAGIIGLAHARAAARRGLSVTILEADTVPRGASVRNFGHACITGQTGEFAELAAAGRHQWMEAAKEADFWAAPTGAFVVATSQAQMAILEQARAEKGAAAIDLLTPERLGAAVTGDPHARLRGAVGGAHLTADLRVDPRTAAPRLAQSLSSASAIDLRTGVRVGRVADGRVETSVGTFTADHVIVCTGHQLPALFPELAAEAELVECALSMTLAATPEHIRTDAAILTRTSLLRYDAFASMPAAEAVRDEVARSAPELIAVGANVMFGPRPDGTIIIGDSHEYGRSVDPFIPESTTDVLLTEAACVLDQPTGFAIRQRWQGVYASSPTRPLLVETVDERTTVATVATGIGMTIAFGLAERTLTALRPSLRPAA
ncbi:TIGR03364 family FAD-dependent oxidoreductase [Brevibacterium casei]|uniref:FAD dependent oxidoreductase domain-containing protein n=1 Tax=Brevibacterium casei S18 TaxID=1229781 RepID=K9B1I6_9MICO|nr:TIGR03364 family FAD-dependent oxidoreductase [Brevibacterium casei]EKU48677.1 FAD dependent oxidoreductase domain-containing protein [Brevibacterium casei S18]MBE4693342.1 TIGR03364 family FAD-dependent oxidoreductase [Brevibacterium casei]MBY3576465.1 TIGR03364 family FAD-dependent oxidoreductase [Brevibacterium casei]MCT2358056.1 TIGR03364 family FAD-dependent oxidoreductase [Brevibacterium casei]